MVRLFPKKSRPVGLPPGSLLFTEAGTKEKIRLSMIEYRGAFFTENEDATLQECQEKIETPSIAWIEVKGTADPAKISAIGERFHIHSLFLEDIVSTGQRSKLDLYQDQVFIVVRFLQYNTQTKELKDEQVSIIFGPNYLVSFTEGFQDIFHPIKERLRQSNSRLRNQGTDFLAYTLLDTIVDYTFVVLEKTDQYLDGLEEEIINLPTSLTLQKIQQAKRNMITLRKAVWPMRDVINRFMKLEDFLVIPSTRLYLQDVHDHTIQSIDIIESFRDVVGGLFDIYLSNINIKTNDIMKVLTIVSTIFVPLTFISSLYGMNFDNMPEIHARYGYPIALSIMIGIAGFMLLFFRRKKWI